MMQRCQSEAEQTAVQLSAQHSTVDLCSKTPRTHVQNGRPNCRLAKIEGLKQRVKSQGLLKFLHY